MSAHFWRENGEPSADDSNVTEPSFRFIIRKVKMIVAGDEVVAAVEEWRVSFTYPRNGLPSYRSHIQNSVSPTNRIGQKFVELLFRAESIINDKSHVIPLVFCVHRFVRADELEARALVESMEQDVVRMVPASGESVDGLKSVTLEADRSVDSCVICMEELGAVVKVMPCDHYFHGDCIVKWLKTNHICPLCRFPMPPSNI